MTETLRAPPQDNELLGDHLPRASAHKVRYGKSSPSHTTQSQLDRLSPDFANVQERAEKIAEKAVQSADLSIKRAQVIGGLAGAALTVALAAFTLYWTSLSKVDLLNQNESALEKRIDDKFDNNERILLLEQ